MMRLEVFVARKVGSLVGLGKNYNKMVPSWLRSQEGGRERVSKGLGNEFSFFIKKGVTNERACERLRHRALS